jgi:hypothetical protein
MAMLAGIAPVDIIPAINAPTYAGSGVPPVPIYAKFGRVVNVAVPGVKARAADVTTPTELLAVRNDPACKPPVLRTVMPEGGAL